jgi:stringent starvation protein B
MYQWIVDNAMTPHLLIDTGVEGCVVPVEHIEDGKIVLNIAPLSISGLVLGDEDITFSARFSGKSHSIYVPVESVLAIYARENGQGMMFSEDDEEGLIDSGHDGKPDPDKPRPRLKIVK